jgi:membrane-bound serine protease (ClpP class)
MYAAVTCGIWNAPPVHADGSHVDLIPFAADVSPASAEFVSGAIDQAQSDGASLIIVELDTFGGDLASMESIREKELGSKVPIIVYVAPSGAHADSAGAYLVLAAPLVAMAPGTRIGSASPVTSSGGDLSATERAKTENALVAQITGDQNAYQRNANLAAQMVTNASAFDDQTAIADGLVNFGASDLADCLRQVDGQSVRLVDGLTITLHVAGLPIETLQPSVRDQLFALLVDPNVLFLLFVLAAVCTYLELSHPGAIVPGVVGGIALLLFLYGAGSLSPNWAGLALMLLAVVLLAVDVRAPTHGVLSLGALISLVIGTIIFFNTGPADQAVNPILIAGVAVGVGAIAALVLRFAWASRRAKVNTGIDGLIGQEATVIQPLKPFGRVRVLGEDWSAALVPGEHGAVAMNSVSIGSRVRVVGADGLRLQVVPAP